MAGQFVIKQIAQEVISEVNQPLYIGGKLADGSDAKITVASNGNVSTATPLTVPSLTVASKPVMSSLLAEYTVTGSPVTSINFSGLDINTHKSYRVELDWICPAVGGAVTAYLFANDDTTLTNYYNQMLYASGTTVNAARTNNPTFAYSEASQSTAVNAKINMTNGYLKCISQGLRYTGSIVDLLHYFIAKTASLANLTKLTLSTSVALAFGVGTKVRIYRGDV